ncbi:MAG: YmL10 [Cirrosporium novae-zelandiae]|nr:MAG: YmL10 [Cirrosporium novae-zelandiae]
MPPRISLTLFQRSLTSQLTGQRPVLSFLIPCLEQQTRSASILGSISDTKGAYQKRIRLGRGPSSGKGKTSGRGQKGQKARSKVPVGFNGGQTPDEVVHGTRGFENRFSAELSPVNLDRIHDWITQGRIDPTKPITLKELVKSRCIHGVKKDGVKLLARGANQLQLPPLHIVVSRASGSAISAIETAGGSVTTRYYTGPSIKRILKGETDPIFSRLFPEKPGLGIPTQKFRYRLPDPAGRKDIEYYRDPTHRGYLSHTVEEGRGPSLFFKPPVDASVVQAAVSKKKKMASDSRLW